MEAVSTTQVVTEFKDCLRRRFKNGHLSMLYTQLFSLFNDEELFQVLEYFKSRYAMDKSEEKDEWFFEFHKSIRQTDFFSGIQITKQTILSTEDEKKRKKLYRNLDESAPDFKNSPEWIELMRLQKLRNTREVFGSGGIFDSLLWNLIHLDTDNELKTILERVFKIYS